MTYEVKATWTGRYPNLCSGEWEITVNGEPLQGLGKSNMRTLRSFETWSFDADYCEQWEEYSDGLEFDEWKKSPPNNLLMSLRLAKFKITDELLLAVYDAVKTADWRSNSCGGCI